MSSDAPDSWPEGVGRRILDELDSTNAAALRTFLQPGEGPFWLMARRQTAGRGRQGRPWQDPVGNFAATYCLPEALPPEEAGLRSFATALALQEALVAATGRPEGFALKWPNDVLLNGGKLAGILLENGGEAGIGARLCIGIGVNLVAAPDAASLPEDALLPVSVLAQTGVRIAPEDLLDLLAPAFDRWDRSLRTHGFGPLRDAWLASAARRGERISVRIGDRRLSGVFETLNDTGALVLRDGMARHVVPAGDVYFSN